MPMPPPEGIIKFHQVWEKAPPPMSPLVCQMCFWRNILFQHGLIGATADGIGYGNVSIRCAPGIRFFITGSGTGGIPELTPEHCTEVVSVDIHRNTLYCRGPVQASSESLSHAAIYQSSPITGAVIHAHHSALWERLCGIVPTTDAAIPYGTPELAQTLIQLHRANRLGGQGLIVMGGHKDGLLSFAPTIEEAASLLLEAMHSLTESHRS
ncbi:MAG: class II aldolase/adducin family protein [Candidatus Kapabacteria bacterium]|nr:class II aldolase/adducin family protein [Candidatus Kapabacteria bacterium]